MLRVARHVQTILGHKDPGDPWKNYQQSWNRLGILRFGYGFGTLPPPGRQTPKIRKIRRPPVSPRRIGHPSRSEASTSKSASASNGQGSRPLPREDASSGPKQNNLPPKRINQHIRPSTEPADLKNQQRPPPSSSERRSGPDAISSRGLPAIRAPRPAESSTSDSDDPDILHLHIDPEEAKSLEEYL